MKITKLEIESNILGRNIYRLDEFGDSSMFVQEEASIIEDYKPFYLQCMVDAGEIETIHSMEDAGFRIVEFRYRKKLDLNSFYKVNQLSYYPYVIRHISEEEDYNAAASLVSSQKADDRFSRDPLIPKELSQKRLVGYLRKAFDHYQDEFIYGLYNKNTNELYAIKTGTIINGLEVAFRQTALKENLDTEKYTLMIDALIISDYIDNGVQFFYTVTSGFNVLEMDLHISGLHYRIETCSVILRKIYS